jgi:hypothetical protein
VQARCQSKPSCDFKHLGERNGGEGRQNLPIGRLRPAEIADVRSESCGLVRIR